MNVQINDTTYEYYNHIADMNDVRNSFIKLIWDSFEYDFSNWYQQGGWTDKYEPHVLVKAGEVVATITVNHVRYRLEGNEKYYIQIGGVLTKEGCRGFGLSKWLMEHIIEQYQDRCDQIYLLCNDSAVDFYPKFGFYKETEYISSLQLGQEIKEESQLEEREQQERKQQERTQQERKQQEYEVHVTDTKMRKLTIANPADRELLFSCYQQSNPYSEFPSMECQELIWFYGIEFEKDHIYYFSEFNLCVVANKDQDSLFLQDVYGELDSKYNKMQVFTAMMRSIAEVNHMNTKELNIRFGFTPNKEVSGVKDQVLVEEDHTLYLFDHKENPFADHRLRFPVLSIN